MDQLEQSGLIQGSLGQRNCSRYMLTMDYVTWRESNYNTVYFFPPCFIIYCYLSGMSFSFVLWLIN